MTRPKAGQEHWVGGFHAVTSAVRSEQAQVVRLAVDRRDRRGRDLERLCRELGVRVERVSRETLDALLEGSHQGVAVRVAEGAGVRNEDDLEVLLDGAGPAPLLLILEGVTDPRNLGACLRSADAAGACAVIVPRSRSAPLTAAARKTASGAAETLPLVAVSNLARTLRDLEARGFLRVGLADDGAGTLWDLSLTGPVALVLGAEETGLRRLTRELCDHLAALPMAGTVESLNVSVAAGVALFEVVRQRRPGP
ncbi:MAG: 23S rRNA (guanosine(2251)-2'-O)-methyltransferase RlmB [Pseudomonadales bacterium]|jgi:23S rRNA (guanosine2251-2'-O)-methyltransferase|nr:23S rRNA (guanosine(2251)-2'-O)-methyltransferase RlmB [Pseudomonadales bacterium]